MIDQSKFDASASMAGYLYQCRLALLLGMQAVKKKPNGHISIEKFDDIAFETDNKVDCLIQAKHHIKPKSLDDKSTDLWKTFRIWIEEFKSGSGLSASKKFMLITTAVAPEGAAMEKLRVGASQEAVKKAHALLRSAAKDSKNETTKIGREAFLALTDEQAINFLSCVEVIDQSSNLTDASDEIKGELRIFAPEHVNALFSYVEGWWLGVVAEHITQNENQLIPLQHIEKKIHEIGKVFLQDELPVEDPEELGAKSYTPDDEDAVFVRQMRIVNLPEPSVLRGVQDFYRAQAQRSKWARESLLLDGEGSRYDRSLEDHWARHIEAEMSEHSPSTDAAKAKLGRQIYFWASRSQYPFRNVVETWISAGSFHSLSDRLKVGWHPDFAALLVDETETEDA